MLGLNMPMLTQGIGRMPMYRQAGKLKSATGRLTCAMPAAVGDHCEIITGPNKSILAEVIGFKDDLAYLLPFDAADSLRQGMTVVRKGRGLMIPTGKGLLGRVVDGLGRPMDGKGPLIGCPPRDVNRPAPPAMERSRIKETFHTGVRAIDSTLTLGRGQRVGIFAGSGVGKSTLLGEITKGAKADINVLALIGERGREVIPFLEDCLGADGLARSIVVIATSDTTPLMRVRATQSAIAIADYFREQGNDVLLMIDSLTRLAMAQREIGLLLDEPPASRGYTPSVFQMLASTIERLGNSSVGSITALLTVLVDGGDLDEPISDCVRSIVDGHIVLDRKIAESGRYPAIDISKSISRVAHEIVDKEHLVAARRMRAIMATYAEVQDLIKIGEYERGNDPKSDRAIDLYPQVEKFLRQEMGERSTFAETRNRMMELTASWNF